jgi:hypothetical protein
MLAGRPTRRPHADQMHRLDKLVFMPYYARNMAHSGQEWTLTFASRSYRTFFQSEWNFFKKTEWDFFYFFSLCPIVVSNHFIYLLGLSY